MLGSFSDGDGGFYDTAAGAEQLIYRPADPADNATPSGTFAAAGALLSYAALTGSARHREAALAALEVLPALAGRYPRAAGWAWRSPRRCSPGRPRSPSSGRPAARPTRDLHRAALLAAPPGAVLALGDGTDAAVPLLAGRGLVDGGPAAYVCRDFTCQPPVTDPAALRAAPPTPLRPYDGPMCPSSHVGSCLTRAYPPDAGVAAPNDRVYTLTVLAARGAMLGPRGAVRTVPRPERTACHRQREARRLARASGRWEWPVRPRRDDGHEGEGGTRRCTLPPPIVRPGRARTRPAPSARRRARHGGGAAGPALRLAIAGPYPRTPRLQRSRCRSRGTGSHTATVAPLHGLLQAAMIVVAPSRFTRDPAAIPAAPGSPAPSRWRPPRSRSTARTPRCSA